MKKLISLAMMVVCVSSYAMRCGNSLINEGDHVATMVELCGEPTWDNGSNVVYKNKDQDGMNYYLHIGENGLIDDIQASRG